MSINNPKINISNNYNCINKIFSNSQNKTIGSKNKSYKKIYSSNATSKKIKITLTLNKKENSIPVIRKKLIKIYFLLLQKIKNKNHKCNQHKK
jgi:hypothetical protein